MSTKVMSAAVLGLEVTLVEVEADTSNSLPGIFIVGLPDKAVDEARERVRAAIKNSQCEMPRSKVTINLAPADLKKQGPSYDLPIAISILQLSKQLPIFSKEDKKIFVGELALDGALRPVNGVLSICMFAKAKGIQELYLPEDNAREAVLVNGIKIFAIKSLQQLTDHLRGGKILEPFTEQPIVSDEHTVTEFDMAHINGQQHAKRALEIAAAGGHNILMSGPPGSGKTLLAKTMVSILPKLTVEESLDISRIYSIGGLLNNRTPLMTVRPFRSPHHTSSVVGGIIRR